MSHNLPFAPINPVAFPRDSGRERAMLWLGIVLALISALPVIVARYPMMSDYPAHLARYRVMLDGGANPDLARHYGFVWQWTGNVGIDLLIGPFAQLFGLEQAGRVLTGIIPPLTGLALVAVSWVLRRRVGIGTLLAMAFVWSPMMLIGLLNFAAGQALALWVFAGWVALRRYWWRDSLMVPAGVLVWVFHLSAWAILGVLVFGYEFSQRRTAANPTGAPWWRAFIAPWPLLGPLVVMALLPGTSGAFSYGNYWWVYKQAIWLKAMRDTSYALDFLGLVAVLAAVALATAQRWIDDRLGWAALMLLAMTIAVPRHISGGDYADYRLVTSGLMVACLAIDWPRAGTVLGVWARVGTLAVSALYLARLAVTTLTWGQGAAQMERYLQALDHIPRGARVASAVVVDSGRWELNRFEHIGAYAVVRREALSNANFAVANVHMLRIRDASRGFVDPSHRILQAADRPVDLADFAPAREADWLWYVGQRLPDRLPLGAVVVWSAPGTLIARLAPAVVVPGGANPPPAPEPSAPLAKSAQSH
ncbi:hypothetical protein GTZ99_00555 [Novosphingobium sp. FSY-8]|uniref:4-amino-4-deoxy-L-arabinose transferase-like glycosyltransferase n=1 Tax=Novosphingobium ovatum TaxID=1908523 RepID=A0ABW9X934_9SPHN|nr:hypothetical protein [Novosphingobium ovatum]NBC35043.1 hypothetical protein [Novosphingobium ovatum]